MSIVRQLLSRLPRLRLRPHSKRCTVTTVTPSLCLLPEPAFASQAPRAPVQLDDLPPELLCLILEYAGPETIVAAGAVCRLLREIVAASSSLQYTVALVLAGLQDGAEPAPAGDRLRALNARTASWRAFQYRDRVNVDIGPGAFRPCYDLHSGIFFVGRRTAANLPIRTLSWLPLPSVANNQVAASWQSLPLDISIDDFALDLRQDLLVLVEMLIPNTTMVHIHLRSFESLQAHPKAAETALTMECAAVTVHSTIVVDLSGKHLGLLFSHDHQTRSDHDRICVWDWTTGETVFFLQGSSTKLTSFVFLMDNVLLVPDVAANALAVYSRQPDQAQFELTEVFGLPELQQDCVLYNANSRYKSRGVHKPAADGQPLPGETPSPGFYVEQEMELVVISLEYRADGWAHFFTLICTKSTFLGPPRSRVGARIDDGAMVLPRPAPLAAPSIANTVISQTASATTPSQAQAPSLDTPAPAVPTHETEARVPWESWGPASTRMIREPLRLWDYFHASTRFLSLSSTCNGGIDDEDSATGRQRTLSGPRSYLRVLEFNPGIVAKAGGRTCDGPVTRPATPSMQSTSSLQIPTYGLDLSSDGSSSRRTSYDDCPAPEEGTMEGLTRRIRVVRASAPNVVRAGPLFMQDVFTRLPYVETVTTSSFELSNVLCDHERVIGLKTNEVLDMESLDVFLL